MLTLSIFGSELFLKYEQENVCEKNFEIFQDIMRVETDFGNKNLFLNDFSR